MIGVLESAPALRGVDASGLECLAAAAQTVDLLPGAVLFEEGDPGDAFYLLVSGTVEVVVTQPTGTVRVLATVGPGDLVGEMAVLYDRPRSARVQATTPASLLAIPAAAVKRLLVVNPSAAAQLMAAVSRRLPSVYLASVPLFAGLDAGALRDLDLEANWVEIAGGQTLFEQGDAPDFLYVVARGRLEVFFRDDSGRQEVVRQVGHGDLVGEVALLGNRPRTATVRAIRDSSLVRLSKADLQRLFERHPPGALEVVRLLAARVRPSATRDPRALVSTIAIVPLDETGLPPECGDQLVNALSEHGGSTLYVTGPRVLDALGIASASLCDDDSSGHRVTTWLRAQEDRVRYVVSACDAMPSAWTRLCVRQADLVLLVGSAQRDPAPGAAAHWLFAGREAPATPKDLWLLHPATTTQPTGTARWLSAYPVRRHHHVRVDRQEDFARLARFLAGTAFGLVMSGGGARAFAHVGVMRALADRGIPVDAVGGVSAGVFPAAFAALGHDVATVQRLCLENMGHYSLLSEATLPMAALLSGRKLVRFLRRLFGEVAVEDLWLPFYCVAANLTTARLTVIDRGPLWQGVRATTSVPGIHPPVCLDGELLVDGGVLDNLPVSTMRARCPGTVIATDVGLTVDLVPDARELMAASGWSLLWARIRPFGPSKPQLPHIFEILTRAATLSSVGRVASMAQLADLHVRTPTAGIPTLDWKAGSVLVERGYQVALDALDTWTRTKESPDG